MLKTIRKFWLEKITIPRLLEEIGYLESHESFISPFFVGQTAYPVKKREYEVKMDHLYKEYEKATTLLLSLKDNNE